MVLVGAVRVVPSGKVYRQIFDDEVHLVRSLEEVRNKAEQHKFPMNSGRIPVVRDLGMCAGKGLLSHRQQKWVEGMPNDDFTENPVLYREMTFRKAQESEDVIAAREVRGLSDFIIPEKTNSNIIERLSERRRGRHNEAVAVLEQELACIGREMEPFILESGELLLTKLSESDKAIELLFKKIESDTDLEAFSFTSFGELWDAISQESLYRRQRIKEMDETLIKLEVARAEKIKDLLRKYTKILKDISYFSPSDVHRFIHTEAMMINQALLANQRAIAKLFVNLMEADLKRELSQWLKWQERLKDWKIMQKDYVVRSFREFMARKEVQEPTAVKRDLENMIKDQISLSRKRMELLQVLCDLLPPTHSKAEINEWYESLVALNKYIDTHNVQHMMIIRIQYERVCQECLANVQLCKNKLLSLKVCTEKEAEKVVNPDFFKMVGRLQSRFEQELEQMDRDFEDLAKHIEQDCKDLYKYFQQAIVLWDEHQLKLSQQENELQVKLNECRRKHENLNQIREANLDIILDKLRTQSSERKLKNLLGKAFASLDVIRAGYEAFHQDLMKIVASYPEAILKELISYSSSIGQYFGVKEVYKQVGSAFEEQVFVEDSEVQNMAETTGDSLLQESEETEQQSESFPQGSTEAEQQTESLTNKTEETNTVENEESSVQETEEAEKPGDGESTAPESEETEHLEDSAESEANRFENGDSPAQAYEEMDYLKDILPESEVLFHDSGEAESCEVIAEVFTTSSGNTYSVLGRKETGKTKTPEIYYAEFAEKTLPVYLENVLVPDSLFTELKKRIRLCFFEHLEKWFVQSLSNSWIIVTAKKEELDSELQLRLHMHQPRRERIEKDIHNVRAGTYIHSELLLHQERLECHCVGVVEALNKEKNEFMKLQEDQNDISKNFRRRIQDMEAIFLSSTKAEKLVALSNSLHSELLNHVEVIQISLRSYRNYLEEALGKLRDSNVDFLKACRLFSEGGNFSPEEVEFFCKRLEKETGRIDFIEGLIMIDMEKMESNYLEQATEVINKFETKFHNLAMDRLFMEKIQRFLTNLQVKIKSEVANSNLQAQTLNSSLEKFLKKIDACAHPTVDKEAVTSEELYDFAKTVMKELKKRSKYLNCLLDPIPAQTEFALRGSIAAAVRSESLKEESRMVVMGLDNVPLLNPSRIGKSVIDDVAVSVIKNLLQIQQPKKSPELRHERDDRSQSVAGAIYQPMYQPIYQPIYQATYQAPTAQRGSVSNLHAESPQNSVPYGNLSVGPKISASVSKKFSVGSIQKYSRSGRIDKKFHIFGEKPKESDHFKGIITCILWEGNDTLLYLAEEFYRKDKHQITRPEYLQETFDHCAELFGQKLLSYQSQTDDYHNSCLIEFWDQLKLFEEQLPHVSHLVIDSLLKEHEQQFRHSTDQIRQLFKEQLEEWDNAKAENKNKLRPALGHPDNLPQLEVLCQEELKRQKDQADGILLNTQTMQACAAECAQNFVSALASLTENLLLELDESITIDDIQVARIEMPKEKISTLIRCKRAGLSLEIHDVKPLTERSSRTWPGIPKTTLTDVPDHILCRETASVTTAKTTLGHVSAEEARDAAYVKYKHKLEEEFAKIKEENTAQLMKAQRWEGWWKQSVQKIKQLYA
ncbi:coiled-coil domain-containing protein 180 isoform X1 [Gopherus evgoodei]|uniref:coiled-coil domain-containing protein 180 isoform X1 n=1 Tax=Gopherus evgoodei TaxID=1825980 RepID=UPI0011CF3652|nr:coiled-coil domain-containing protein 180 isoform X1 [Gopherus evgoodei]